MSNALYDLVRNVQQYARLMDINPRTQKPIGWITFEFFTYTAAFTPLGTAGGATGNLTQNISIQSDSDFILMSQQYQCYAATPIQVTQTIQPAARVLLTDGTTSKQLMDNPVPIPALFGDGRLPYILPQPRWFAANSTLQVQVTSLDATNAVSLYMDFSGVKVYSGLN